MSEPTSNHQAAEILRFRRAERLLHWGIAVPFVLCYLSAVVLVFVYNPDPQRPYRAIFAWVHRIAGACLIGLPTLAILTHPRDWKIHLHNIGSAWRWTFDDIKWLLLLAATSVSKRLKKRYEMPEAGKFNAGEKLNFMMVMTSSPLFIISGLLIWMPNIPSYYPWIFHMILALVVTPLMFGHIFMATINPSTRKGLTGMVSGKVDREWARHHYAKWFRAHHESKDDEPQDPPDKEPRDR